MNDSLPSRLVSHLLYVNTSPLSVAFGGVIPAPDVDRDPSSMSEYSFNGRCEGELENE